MLEELDLLINFLQTEYLEFNKKWMQSSYYERINFKDNKVCDLNNNEHILNTIFNYREFINKNNIFLLLQLQSFEGEKEKINTRVKLKNSIQYKIENYIKNHNAGEIPINKCLNDLFGIRVILSEELGITEIIEFVHVKYPNLKVIDSSKGEYKATHIYFRDGNYNFQWELQIWNKCDEATNIESHRKYKQEYVKWEKSNKGGEI